MGGHHEARTAVEERVAGRWENLVGECYGVGGGGEGRKAYLVASDPSRVKEVGGGCEVYGFAENPGVDRLGVRGTVKSTQGINTPGVDALPRGDVTVRVVTKGNGVTGADRWGC